MSLLHFIFKSPLYFCNSVIHLVYIFQLDNVYPHSESEGMWAGFWMPECADDFKYMGHVVTRVFLDDSLGKERAYEPSIDDYR